MLIGAEADEYLARFDGVPPSVLSDGTWLLDQPAFWLGHVDGCADGELIIELFGSDFDGMWELVESTRESGRWPVVRIASSQADLAVVSWFGFDSEEGCDFVVLPHGSQRALCVASVEGHGAHLGLSWPEVDRVVQRGRVGTAAQRLVLLLPALGDADAPEDAIRVTAEALLTVGARSASVAAAEEMARHVIYCGLHWSRHGEILVCDSEAAVRREGGLPHEDLLLVTRGLA